MRAVYGFAIVITNFWWLRSAEWHRLGQTLSLLSDTFVHNELMRRCLVRRQDESLFPGVRHLSKALALCRQSAGKSFVVMAEIRFDTLHPPQDIPETAHEGMLKGIYLFSAVGQTLCIGAEKVVAVDGQLSVKRPAGIPKTREHILLDC